MNRDAETTRLAANACRINPALGARFVVSPDFDDEDDEIVVTLDGADTGFHIQIGYRYACVGLWNEVEGELWHLADCVGIATAQTRIIPHLRTAFSIIK
jgi:hypothetical protein